MVFISYICETNKLNNMKNEEKKALDLMNVDPLAVAEKISGKSYKEDEATSIHGLAISMRLGDAKKDLLESLGDTTFITETSRYINIVENFGFELSFHEKFESKSSEQTENFYIYFHPKYSLLLVFDTFRGNVNGSNVYYNLAFQSGVNLSLGSGSYLSSQFDLEEMVEKPYHIKEPRWSGMSWEEFQEIYSEWKVGYDQYIKQNNLYKVFIGHFDGREGLITKIKNMAEKGKFLTDWVDVPFLWLLHHGNKNSDDYERINSKVIESLPENIQKLLTKKSTI